MLGITSKIGMICIAALAKSMSTIAWNRPCYWETIEVYYTSQPSWPESPITVSTLPREMMQGAQSIITFQGKINSWVMVTSLYKWLQRVFGFHLLASSASVTILSSYLQPIGWRKWDYIDLSLFFLKCVDKNFVWLVSPFLPYHP